MFMRASRGRSKRSGQPLCRKRVFRHPKPLSRSVIALQEKALVQLEVAEFALDQIFDEVAEVMAITPRMRTTRERVTAARPSHGFALAA